MWMKTNPNPGHKEVSDSAVRAIAIALNRRWLDIYDDLCRLGREEFNMPSADSVWSRYLYETGFRPFQAGDSTRKSMTVTEFCLTYPEGIFVIGTGSHVLAVINGEYYDSWDSGNEVLSFFWKKES